GEQVLISGINSLRIQFNSPQTVTIGKASSSVDSLEIVGESSAYCSFYQVRSGVLELIGPSILTLGTSNTMAGQPFSLTAHGSLSGNLTSRVGESASKPGFTCTRVRTNGAAPGNVDGNFSPQGGDSMLFSAFSDSRLDFILAEHSEVGDTQIPILEEL